MEVSMRREGLVLVLLAGLLPLLFFGAAPIHQPVGYHELADQRPLLGIRHFWNVVSNLPFLLFGLMGLQLLRRRKEEAGAAWAALFAGSVAAALGSAWYHLNPDNTTLMWDRLPIGIAFMGFFTALLVEQAATPTGATSPTPSSATPRPSCSRSRTCSSCSGPAAR
jgi:hypothetical protein